jgi:GT2 family glycosyltransferase
MPFAGTADEAQAALASLTTLELGHDDELILADNCGAALGLAQGHPACAALVRVIDASGERSPAHARNAGAAAGDAEWILFLDADTVAPPGLLHRYFTEPIADDVGAVAGGIVAPPLAPSAGIVARYGAHKNFLDAGAHLAHPFLPRAAAANLLVRRAAFDAVGGFFEGLRAAEDTDFSWRLQRAGWTLAGRPSAAVQHAYRDSVGALRRQWRGYAAGRAWLGRRYPGFEPRPAVLRAAQRALGRAGSGSFDQAAVAPPPAPERHPGDSSAPLETHSHPIPVADRDRLRFGALDVLLGVEELFGFVLSNRPPAVRSAEQAARQVLVADRLPDAGTGASGIAVTAGSGACGMAAAAGSGAEPSRIEAGGRADRAPQPAPGITIVYREDDGPLDRARALASLAARHPGRVLTAAARDRHAPSPAALAPAACRLLAEPAVTLAPADPSMQAAARRLGRLAGRGSPRRRGWREMRTQQAKSSKHAPAAGDHGRKAGQ